MVIIRRRKLLLTPNSKAAVQYLYQAVYDALKLTHLHYIRPLQQIYCTCGAHGDKGDSMTLDCSAFTGVNQHVRQTTDELINKVDWSHSGQVPVQQLYD